MDNICGIIGSAGSRGNHTRINPDIWNEMYRITLETLNEWQISHAVSGGAAFSDHLAVKAFNEGAVKQLTLFLPAHWTGKDFAPNPKVRFNPGVTANNLHKKFSQAAQIDSLSEISQAIAAGANVQVFEGFHRRNTEVADLATHMLAFTFGTNHSPRNFTDSDAGFSKAADAGLDDGGTKDTWEKSWRALNKKHVSLTWLEKNPMLSNDPTTTDIIPF